MEEKVKKKTLHSFYESLPKADFPKTNFIREVARRCNVSEPTVRNWINTSIKPIDLKSVDVLVEMTGIPAEELWDR